MKGELKDPRKTFGKAVSDIAENDERIYVLSADSGGSSGFKEFAAAHPDRYFEFGIMEQGVTGIASGMATTGKIPVFCAIAPFVTCRNYEMFRNDLGYMRQNVKIVGRNGGFTYSDLGATHHSLEDYAIMRMIPGVVVLAPQSPDEIRGAAKAHACTRWACLHAYRQPAIPELYDGEREFVIGKGQLLRDGSDLTIISTGSTTVETLKAAETLAEKGVSVMVIGMPTVCPIDEGMVLMAAKKTGRIMTVEEHYVHGGLGTLVAEVCAENYPVPIKMHGVPKEYATSGPYDELLHYYKLDAEGIEETALAFLKK